MSKLSREKGAAFERATAIAFRPLFPGAARELTECRTGLGVDLINTGNLRVQCKRGRKYAPLGKIEEVPEEAGTIPLLVTQGDRKETLVALRLLDFLAILKDPTHVKGIGHGVREEERPDEGSPEERSEGGGSPRDIVLVPKGSGVKVG